VCSGCSLKNPSGFRNLRAQPAFILYPPGRKALRGESIRASQAGTFGMSDNAALSIHGPTVTGLAVKEKAQVLFLQAFPHSPFYIKLLCKHAALNAPQKPSCAFPWNLLKLLSNFTYDLFILTAFKSSISVV
jgi:hypothetical protein